MPEAITEEVPKEQADPSTGALETAGSITIQADPTKQYVSGGVYASPWLIWQQYLQTLPNLIDDVEWVLGDAVYEDMLKDPTIWSRVQTLLFSVFNQELSYRQSVKEEHPDYAKATEIMEFCRANIIQLEESFMRMLHQMCSALAFGNKVAEKVYEVQTTGPYKDKLMLKEVNVKPRRAVAFVVDRFRRLVGILGLVNASGGFVSFSTVDPDNPPTNLFPREKFAILTFLMTDMDPRGDSWLRSVYTYWWRKLQRIGEHLKHSSQLVGGMLIAKTPEKAMPYGEVDANNVPVLDPATGRQKVVYPEAKLAEKLENVKNGAIAVFPYGTEVDILVEVDGGEAILSGIKWEDENISQGLTFQTLSHTDSQHNTRAASKTHAETRHLPETWVRMCVERFIRHELFIDLVSYNFGPEYTHLAPYAFFSDTPQESRPELMGGVARLQMAGWFAPEQKQDVDVQLGLPKRSDESVQREMENQETQDQMQQKALEGMDEEEEGEDDERDTQPE